MADFSLGGLLGGGGGLYDDLLTPQQQSQLSSRGLLAMAGAFADAGMPSRLPIPLGAALGKAAAAMGAGRDEAALSLLKAGMTVQELKALKQKMALNDQLTPYLQRLAAGGGLPGVGAAAPAGAAPAIPGDGATAPVTAAGADPGPGGGPTAAVPSITQYGMPPRQDLSPYTGLRPAMKASSLDTVLPRGPGGPGGLLVTPASYNGGGAAAPGGDQWLMQNAPFPTLQRPVTPPIQWTNDQPRVPFGQDPGDFLPGGGAGTPPFGQGGETPVRSAVSSGDGLPATPANWETAHNNLGGMRIPGVNATPTQGGFQSFSTPEQGLAAISRQLDRYASGATTGRPLTTIKDIVSTWAPPSENPTETLIQRAERVMGVGRNVPLDLSNPATKAKLIEATIRNEQGDRLPVDPPLISKVAGASPDQYIPSGPASSLPITRAQYSGGLPGGGAAPLATPPGAGAALATPSGGGVIPGTGMTPQQLGALNALMKMGGLGDPLNSLLETYYKSPAYLGEAAGASKRGELGVELELRPKLEAAIAWAKIDPNINEAERKAQIDRYSKQLEQIGAAQTTTVKDVPVLDQNGQIVLKNMLQSEITLNSADRAARAARGDTTPRSGDIVGTPFAIGNTPPGYEYRMTPQGALAAQPVPGTPAAQEAQDVLRKQKQSDLQLQVSRDIVMQNTDRIENLVRNSALPTTGAGGAWLSRLGGTAANDVRVMVETLKARSSLDALNQMRQSSSTGGALGNVSNAEGDRLAAALSNLDQSQSQEQFLFNLRRAKQAYVEAVHGPGAYSALSDAPVLKVPNAGAGAVARPEGSTDATLRSEAAAAIAGGRSRAAVIERLQKMGVSTEGL